MRNQSKGEKEEKEIDFRSNSQNGLGGHPKDPPDAKDRKSVLIYTDGFIIVTEFCERLAYYGFAGSLVLFFQTQLGYSNADADVQYSLWSSACYVTPLIGGYIADTYLGRYRSILVSLTVFNLITWSCC
jgi:hypothetical protein